MKHFYENICATVERVVIYLLIYELVMFRVILIAKRVIVEQKCCVRGWVDIGRCMIYPPKLHKFTRYTIVLMKSYRDLAAFRVKYFYTTSTQRTVRRNHVTRSCAMYVCKPLPSRVCRFSVENGVPSGRLIVEQGKNI